MTDREVRLAPSSRGRTLLLLVPLVLTAFALLGLLAQSASAADPPTVSGPAAGSSPAPVFTFTQPDDTGGSTTSYPDGATTTVTITRTYDTECAVTSGPATDGDFVDCSAAAGARSYTASLPAEGAWTFSARTVERTSSTTAVEGGSTTGPTLTESRSAARTTTYSYDATAPVVTVAPPTGPYAASPGWQVGVTDTTAVTLTCTLTGPGVAGSDVPCTAGAVRPALGADGTYVLSVTGRDAAGNPTAAPVSATYVHDATAPTVGVVRTTAPVGKDGRPSWTVTVDGATSAECVLEGPGSYRLVVSCADGATVAPTLTEPGTYTLVVTARDEIGNTAVSDPSTYVLDTTAPTVVITGPTSGSGPTVDWSVTVTGADAPTGAVTCDVSGVVRSPCAPTVTGSRDTDGDLVLTVTARDAAGNVTVATATYTRSSTPAAPTVTPSPTGGRTKTVVWTLQGDSLTTRWTCTLTRDGIAVPGPDCSFTGSGPHSVTTVLDQDGLYVLTVRAGNTSSPDTTTGSGSYLLDATEPAGPALSPAGSTTGSTAPSWTWTAEPGRTTECRLTVGTAAPGAWTPCSGSVTVSTPAQTTYVLEVRYYDSLGNTGDPSVSRYTFDSVAPAAPTAGGPTGASRSGDITWTLSGAEAGGSYRCRLVVDGVAQGELVTCGSTVTRTGLADGRYALEVVTVDAAGNTSVPVTTATRTVDTVAPARPGVTGPTGPSRDRSITWTLTGAEPDGSYACRLVANGVAQGELVACGATVTRTGLDDGAYALEVVAFDAARNASDPVTSGVRTVDNAGPAAPSVDLPVRSGRVQSATWTVTPSEAGTTSQCRLTRTAPGGAVGVVQDWTACTSYAFGLDAGDGTYVLSVRTLDALGNVGAATTGPGYLLDATAPAAPTVTGPTGTSSATAVTYTFATGDDRATCTLRRGTEVVATYTDCHLRTQPFAVDLPRTSGTYVLDVVLTDAFGNESAAGSSAPYVLDVTAPDAPAVTSSLTGTGSERKITWTFAGEGTATCRLLRDGELVDTYDKCEGKPFTLTLPTVSGAYVLEVVLTDVHGNASAPGRSAVYVLDVTPPLAPQITVTPSTGNVRSATWSVVAPEKGTTAECRLHRPDGTVTLWAACAAPFTVALTAGDGAYALEVRLTDSHGNLGPAVLGPAHVLDTTPPVRPVVGSDRSGTDDQRVVVYTFTGEGTATCQLTRDGVAVGAEVVGCLSGTAWTLPDVSGTYVLLVTHTDAVGNTGAAGASPDYQLDVTAPAAPVVTGSRSGVDNERTVTWTFAGEGTATCRLLRDGVAVGAAIACTSPFTLDLPAVDGTYVLEVVLTDAVGNSTAPTPSGSYVLDLTPPAAPTVSGPTGTRSATTATFSFSGEGTATCQLLRNGAPVGGPTSCSSPVTVALTAGDGSYALQVFFTDAVGNVGAATTSAAVLLDTLAPAGAAISGPAGPAQSRAPSWTFVAESGTTARCRLVRGATVVLDWQACAGGLTADLTALPDGAYVLEVELADAAGNTTSRSSSPYVLDTTAPEAPVVRGPSGPSQDRRPGFTWTGEAGATAQCQLARDGTAVGGWVACAPGFAPLLEADGTWTVAVRLTDAAGNVSGGTVSGGYVLDTTPPAAPGVTPPRSTGRDTAPVWAVVVEPGASLECRLLSTAGVLSDWAPCTGPHATSLVGQPDGRYVLEVRATDRAGGRSEVGSGAYVLDTTPPAAPVVTVPAAGRGRTPVVTFTSDPGTTTTCRLTSGSTVVFEAVACTSPTALPLTGLDDGTYTLTVRAVDAAGNPGPAGTGTYVLDTTGPAAPVFTALPGSPGPDTTPTWSFRGEAGGTFTCRVVFPTGAVRELGTCTSPLTVDLTGLPDGTYVLQVRAVDAVGNLGVVATSSYELVAGAVAAPVVSGPAGPSSSRTPTWSISGTGQHSCRLVRGTTVLVDWADCGATFEGDLFGQPDGAYVLQARSRTAAGVSGVASSRYVLDTAAPGAAVLVAPPSPSTDLQPTWTVASAEYAARAECRVLLLGSEVRPWAPCGVSPAGVPFTVDLTGLGDGTYVLEVRLYDAADNRGEPTSSTYRLDRSAPVAVGVTAPPSPGSSVTPVWLLAAPLGVELECQLVGPTGVVDPWSECAGQYTASLSGLPDGTYTLFVRALSAAGTPGPETSRAYVLATALPDAPTALTGPGPLGKDRAPEFTFTLPSGTTGYCRVTSAGTVVAQGVCGPTTYVLDLSSAPDGVYVLSVVAVDEAGNESAPATRSYELDTRPTDQPVLVAGPPATGSSLEVTWRFTVVRGATAECRLLYDGRVLEDWTACAALTYTARLSGKPDGLYVLQVRAVDGAGNASPPVEDGYRLDRTGVPVPTFTSVPATPSPQPTVTWTFTTPEGSLECRTTAPGAAPTTWVDCSSGRYDLTVAGGVQGQAHLLEVRVVLADGRRGAPARAYHVLDTVAPGPVTLAPAPTAGREATITWSWTATETLVECRLLKDGVVVRGWAACTSGTPLDLAALGQGLYELEVRQVDDAELRGSPVTASYRYDTAPPPAPQFTSQPPARGTDATVGWTFAVPGDVVTSTCYISSRGQVRTTACQSGRIDLSGAAPGTYVLRVEFRDAAGNASTMTTTYELLAGSVTGPVRVDPPPVARPGPDPFVPSDPAPTGPGRFGTGAPDLLPPPAPPAVPDPAPLAEDFLTGSPTRASTPAPAGDDTPAREERSVTGVQPPLPPADVPEVIAGVVGDTFKRPTLPLALLALVVLFLLAQNRIDRRDPKLAAAPVEAEPELDFLPFRSMPGGAS